MRISSYQHILSQVIDALASERRRVAALWRLTAYAHRILGNQDLAQDPSKFNTWREAIANNRSFEPVKGGKHVFLVVAPFANYLTYTDEQILEEVNPWAVISHYSAMIHHGITYEVPNRITASLFNPIDYERPPLGILPEEWADVPKASNQTPLQLGNTKVQWARMSQKYNWGTEVAESNGVPIYVTDLERTLIDIIRQPAKSGGMQIALQAWSQARTQMDIDKIVRYTDRYSVKILQQRIGYILETMGFQHKKLEAWKNNLLRGGSVKFIAGNDYSGNYDTKWNISLNANFDIESILNG